MTEVALTVGYVVVIVLALAISVTAVAFVASDFFRNRRG